MRNFLIPVSLLITLSFSSAAKADDAEWLTEDQMQKMSLAELQQWANKTDKSVKKSRIFDLKSKKSHTHMERRLGYHPMLAENSPDIPLRDELKPKADARPDGGKSAAYPEPHYYDETMKEDKGLVGDVLKVVGSPFTGTAHMLHHVGRGFEKVLYFLDERFPWI
ncbi:MAG: hypothetical protein K2X81_06050 [Candidatus Obscuribacterales bacterium]|nr:hypothetical protein [Candidatus Obscuribacterales bacterium]